MGNNFVTTEIFIEQFLEKTDGWCSKDKAYCLAKYVKEKDAQLCVEIGVFGGASLIPVALALKEKGSGAIVGIDPWDPLCSLEEMKREENIEWWGKLDYEDIYSKLVKDINLYDINEQTVLVRAKSEDVHEEFYDLSIDILHIDGNHSEKLAYQDSTLYFPKVKVGGIIFYDDASWTEENKNNPSTQKGLDYLRQYCKILEKTGLDCIVLQKIKNK